jgi:FMN phosphatase YigB (HAD superfamily)
MTDFKHIKNIIFDLGAVIIDIDFEKTFHVFSELSSLPIHEVAKRYHSATFFSDFEKGLIGNYTFVQNVRELLQLPIVISDQQIIDAWNKLLITIPTDRIDRIKVLSKKYRLFLLSNTNPVHIYEVNNILHKTNGIDRLERLFETTWYSYDLGLIKPHVSIYERVLSDKLLNAEETVFLDDNAENIHGALKTGIKALHVQGTNDLIELLKYA